MKIVQAGTADATDLALVEARLNDMPDQLLEKLAEREVKMVVCRDNVTTSGRKTFGEPPENWPKGKGWVDVPGCYIPETREVVIATLGEDDDRRLAGRNERHGAYDLIFHEVMHADDIVLHDNAWHWRSDNLEFQLAWRADIESGNLSSEAYEAQLAREGYAESAARYFAGDPALEEEWPHMAGFWEDALLPVPLGPLREASRRSIDDDYADKIGTVRVNGMGHYELDLIGRNASGVIGHALIVLEEGEPAHSQVAAQLGRRRSGADLDGRPVMLEPF